MRAVVQRVSKARVWAEGDLVSEIAEGLVVFVGVGRDDKPDDVTLLADKIANLRIFEDDDGKLNRSVRQIEGECLVVSQFTLFGDCRKGRRPSFSEAAPPAEAKTLYERVGAGLRGMGLKVEEGLFQERTVVELANDGPVTFLLDTRKAF